MADDAPFLPGLSPVTGKPVHVAFDGGRLTSDAGVLVLAEIERKLEITERLAVPRHFRPDPPGDVPTIEPTQSTANADIEGRKRAPGATLTHARSRTPNCPHEQSRPKPR